MYTYWSAHRDRRNGLGPTPTELSAACGTSYQSAKEAVTRYRRGRVPTERRSGLSPKSVRNIHRLLHRAFADAVAWDYLAFNPAAHASLPHGLDLDGRTLEVSDTLISVGGAPEESDGKSEAGCRTISLDDFTVAALRRHLEKLDEEREAFGDACADDGWLFVW